MVYLYAVPRALGQYRGVMFDGLVTYEDHEVRIPGNAVDETFISNLAQLIRRDMDPGARERIKLKEKRRVG